MLKVYFTTQHFLHYQPEYFPIIHISGLVHIDTSDPIRVRAGLVCHATQTLATHHRGAATEQSLQALSGNVSRVYLCECTNLYINH